MSTGLFPHQQQQAQAGPPPAQPNGVAPQPQPQNYEEALRAPHFRGEVPIMLADGVVWWFVQPRMTTRLYMTEHGITAKRGSQVVGDEYVRALEELDTLVRVGSDEPTYLAKVGTLAFSLLAANYSFGTKAAEWLPSLFVWDPVDERLKAMWASLNELVHGALSPKLSGVGSPSPALQTGSTPPPTR